MAASRVQVEKCEKCHAYYVCNTTHQCKMADQDAVEEPKKCDNLKDDDTVWMVNQCTDQENESEKLYSNLISAIEVRRPLYDHRLSLSKRSEAIKNKLWNEIYVELQGQITVEELKKKWGYLREKFVRERQKPKSGAKGGIKKKNWVHYIQLSFLEDVVTHDKKTTSNLENNNDTDDSSECVITSKGQKRKSKNENDFQRDLLNELKLTRPILLEHPELNEEPQYDPDVDFGQYVVSLIKEVPKRNRKKLQCKIIYIIVNAQDSD